jgi:aminopeptidase N
VCACSSDDDEPNDPPTSGSGGSAGSGGSGGAGPTGEISGEVTHFAYRFDLTSATAHGELSVAVAPPGGDCYSVHSALAPTTVTWNDAPATQFALDAGTLHACGSPLSNDDTLRLGSDTTVPEQTFFGLDVGFSRQPSLGGTFNYLLSWVGGCDLFAPCDDKPSLLGTFDFEVTHPAGTVVLCPGTLDAESTVTRCRLDGTLAPTYSAFAIASDTAWQRQPFTSGSDIDLVFYEPPNGMLAASLDPMRVEDFLAWITDLLGPYPYGGELRIASGPTTWLGFEHPANIVLNEDLPVLSSSYADLTMHVFMHEVVHQWSGDRTTLASVHDFVWKEAIAEYLTYVFEEESGPPGEGDATRLYWDSISPQANYYPRPTEDVELHLFFREVYGPGPMTLFVQLEPFMGRPLVLQAIAAFLSAPGARSVDELRLELERASGDNLQTYFDSWVVGSGAPSWPSFAASTMQAGDQVTVTLTQGGTPLPCRVEVRVVGATTSAVALLDFGLDNPPSEATATVTLAEPVMTVEIDPAHRVINMPVPEQATSLPVWIF